MEIKVRCFRNYPYLMSNENDKSGGSLTDISVLPFFLQHAVEEKCTGRPMLHDP